MKVEIKNTTFCKAVDEHTRRKLTRLLRYKQVWFRQGEYCKIKESRFASFVDSRSGFFLAGFMPRILRKYPALQIERKKAAELLPVKDEPSLLGIKLRGDQLKAVKAAVSKQRGVIKFATASGKTVIAAGIISCFDTSTVFLAHSKEIVGQTYERLKEYGFDTGIMTGEQKINCEAKVLCATIQTYIKAVDIAEPDVVIVDESHHVQKIKGQYGKLLSKLKSPVKIGLTGTLPKDRFGKLCLEGLIGPVIARLTIQEGIEKNILSLPKITLLSVTKLRGMGGLPYHKMRDKGITNNSVRNDLIVREVSQRVLKNKSCLIIVNEIEHGDNLNSAFTACDFKAIFLQGKTQGVIRQRAKKELIKKDSLCVITTNIWNEGVDIPTLDVVVLAFGGKASTRTIQAIGRGLRRTTEKDRVEIIDFLDPYRYLAEHLVARLQIYKKEKLF